MEKDRTKDIPYIKNLPYKLKETARISELMARSYYKKVVLQGAGAILELDEFQILSHILQEPDLSQSDISKRLYKGKAHIGKILNDMEQKKYIKRIPATQNNIMIKRIIITDYGKELYSHTNEAFRQLGKQVLACFSDEELEKFSYLLDKLKSKILEQNELSF